MKYIITENKLNDLIKLYLNNQDTWQWDIGDGEFHVSDGYEGDTIFSYTIGSDEEGLLYIRPKIIVELKDMFGNSISFEEYMKAICEWFNEKYDTNVIYYEVVMED